MIISAESLVTILFADKNHCGFFQKGWKGCYHGKVRGSVSGVSCGCQKGKRIEDWTEGQTAGEEVICACV